MRLSSVARRYFLRGLDIDRPRTARHPSSRKRSRPLVFEHFEDRRLLAVAVSDYYVVNRNETLTVGGLGLMENDQYRDWHTTDDDPVNAYGEFTSAPTHGSLAAIDGGVTHNDLPVGMAFTYIPDPGYVGTDTFTYRIWDQSDPSWDDEWQEWSEATDGAWSTSTVLIQVNTPPVAADDSFTAAHGSPLTIAAPAVLANDSDDDGDNLMAALFSAPGHGTINLLESGQFTYTPDADYLGPDSFVYRAFDGVGYSDPATVAINVLPINDDFLANDDTYSIPSGLTLHPAAPALLANDTAPEGVSFTAVLADGPAHASEFTLNSDGSFTYKSADAYVGPDSFTYEITDGQATSYAATVSITVEDDPDIAITAFYSDGITLQVQYVVLPDANSPFGPFSIGIYKSYDGVNPVGGPLETADAITSAGVHTVPITATFVDPQEDYYLLAKVDWHNDAEETNENDNVRVFDGGAFVDYEDGTDKIILHVQGTEAGNAVWLTTDQINGQPHLRLLMPRTLLVAPPGGNGTPYYDVTGDGLITMLDAQAVDNYLGGQSGGWQNPNNRFDVDGDGNPTPTPSDALAIINELNARGQRLLTGYPPDSHHFFDVSGELVVSVLDAQQVIDKINGGDGTVSPPGHNSADPFAVSYSQIDYYLAFTRIDYGSLAPDQVHIRTHGGDEYILVDNVPATVFAGDGNDTVDGSQYDDKIDGGNGDDHISGDAHGWIYNHYGNDTLLGGAGNDVIWALGGNDTINGDTGDDYLDGGDGDDIVVGGTGSDTLDGGAGNNTLDGGNGENTINAGDGNNVIYAGDGGDTITAGDGNNVIHGGNGGDFIIVGDGDNSINASGGNDTIYTGTGVNDTDAGGGNNDVNGFVDLPKIELLTDSAVQEGHSLSAFVWLSEPTNHEVTATLYIRRSDGTLAAGRWSRAQVNVVIPAGQEVIQLALNSVDDHIIQGPEDFTISLENPSGAESGADQTSHITMDDNDIGIWVAWGGGSEVPTSFNAVLAATMLSDSTLNASGIDNYGHPFNVQVSTNETTGASTIELTVQGISPAYGHWTGTSDSDPGGPWSPGGFPMYSEVAFGAGEWALVLPPAAPGPGPVVYVSGTLVSKSYIDTVTNIGSMPTLDATHRLGDFTASIFVNPWIWDGDVTTPAADGEYRLRAQLDISAGVQDGQFVTFGVAGDSQGGMEFPTYPLPIYGTHNLKFNTVRISDSAYAVNWTTWGRPNNVVEPGFQGVWPRTSRNIWHQGSVLVEANATSLTFTLLTFRGSDFPSHKLWIGDTEEEYLPQGPISSLWRRDLARGDAFVSENGAGPFFPH